MLPAPTTTKDPPGRSPLTSWGSFSIFKPSPRFLHFPVRHRSYQGDSGLRMARGRSVPSLRPIPLPQPIFSGSQTDWRPQSRPPLNRHQSSPRDSKTRPGPQGGLLATPAAPAQPRGRPTSWRQLGLALEARAGQGSRGLLVRLPSGPASPAARETALRPRQPGFKGTHVLRDRPSQPSLEGLSQC